MTLAAGSRNGKDVFPSKAMTSKTWNSQIEQCSGNDDDYSCENLIKVLSFCLNTLSNCPDFLSQCLNALTYFLNTRYYMLNTLSFLTFWPISINSLSNYLNIMSQCLNTLSFFSTLWLIKVTNFVQLT